MCRLPTAYKRIYLRILVADNDELGEPFADTLLTVARRAIDLTKDGQIILGTAGNGHSVTFAPPATGQGTVMDHAELIEEFFGLYETAKANRISAGTAEPTKLEITNEMLALLEPAASVSSDYSYLSRV